MGSAIIDTRIGYARSAVVVGAVPAFEREGGRLAATQLPSGGELCLQPGRISAPQNVFRMKSAFALMGSVRTDARVLSGSNALGGTG